MLDPFAGAGTTLVESQSSGLSSVGYEPHPFFAEMARAKLASDLVPEDIDLIEMVILDALSKPAAPAEVWAPGPVLFLRKLIPENALSQLAPCPGIADTLPARLQPVFRLIVSRTLEGSSGSRTDGIYKAPTSLKRSLAVDSALRSVCAELREDLLLADSRPPAVIIEQPAGNEILEGASLCVTSPPYLNNFDFAEMTRMELYFWRWAESWREITDLVRSRLLVNTTTAPSHLKGGREQFADSLSGDLFKVADRLHDELAIACSNRNKDYNRLVFPYIHGLDEVIGATSRSLKDKAPIHIIVADSALYGVHIPLHTLVAQMLHRYDFQAITVKHLRERGDRWVLAKRKGPRGKLGEYWISAVR